MEKKTPKEYLRQLRTAEIKIEQKEEELERLKASLESISTGTDSERVQTTPRDRLSEEVPIIADLKEEIKSDIKALLILKNKIINEIQSMDNPVYINILYKRYVQYKSLEEIAVEMSYVYVHTRRLHGLALQAFKARYPQKFQ